MTFVDALKVLATNQGIANVNAMTVHDILTALAALPPGGTLGNITTQGNVFNGASQLIQLDGTGKIPALNASQVTSIVNACIAAGAAIAYSKLALGASIVNADIAAGAAIAYSKLALAASIVNADIAAGAAIAGTKTNGDFGGITVQTTGLITAGGAIQGGSFKVAGTQVVAARNTGWTNIGTLTNLRAGLDPTTATTADCAKTINGIITAMVAHGLIGA